MKAAPIFAPSQPLISTGERSGLLTHIATTESVSLLGGFLFHALRLIELAYVLGRLDHFVVAVWRAKEAYAKYDHRPVALRIELVHKIDYHLILKRLMIRE